ncbi:protein takeout-like isoform X1 [Sabethes cyaneus]|uniref:protein takeout-like isoform X1 n=1 Tax=Sabethes cyaneus TaxID=53552 RepID=UPI00237D4A6E|nr:protein takeout-like isoform X1 [Sabethes cyaneus]
MTITSVFTGVLFALLVVLSSCNGAKFPPGYTLCKPNDEKCLFERIGTTFAKHSKGIPEVNLVSLDPLIIEKMDIVQGDGPINIVLNFKNVELTGLSQSVIKKANGFTADPTKMDLGILVPVASLIGGYKINGKVLILPIQGEGHSNMTMENCHIQLKWTGKLVDRANGKKHYQVDKLKATFDTTRFYMHFSNLFNGDKALGDNMNQFLNDNWQDILKELKPAIVNAFVQIFQSVVSNVFNKVPYAEMFQ